MYSIPTEFDGGSAGNGSYCNGAEGRQYRGIDNRHTTNFISNSIILKNWTLWTSVEHFSFSHLFQVRNAFRIFWYFSKTLLLLLSCYDLEVAMAARQQDHQQYQEQVAVVVTMEEEEGMSLLSSIIIMLISLSMNSWLIVFTAFLSSHLILSYVFFPISSYFHIFRSVFGDAAVEKVRPDMGGGGGGGSGYAGGCAQMKSVHESGNSFLLSYLLSLFFLPFFFSSFLPSFFLFICLFISLHICIYHSLICTYTTTHRCTHARAWMYECSWRIFLPSLLLSSWLPLQFEFECRCDGRQQAWQPAWWRNNGNTMTLRSNSISIIKFNWFVVFCISGRLH